MRTQQRLQNLNKRVEAALDHARRARQEIIYGETTRARNSLQKAIATLEGKKDGPPEGDPPKD